MATPLIYTYSFQHYILYSVGARLFSNIRELKEQYSAQQHDNQLTVVQNNAQRILSLSETQTIQESTQNLHENFSNEVHFT